MKTKCRYWKTGCILVKECHFQLSGFKDACVCKFSCQQYHRYCPDFTFTIKPVIFYITSASVFRKLYLINASRGMQNLVMLWIVLLFCFFFLVGGEGYVELEGFFWFGFFFGFGGFFVRIKENAQKMSFLSIYDLD